MSKLNEYVNHSGGALGSDTEWGKIGKEYGMTTNNHYYAEGSKTPNGNYPVSKESLKEADPYLIETNKVLKRRYPTRKEFINNLLRRNYWQVKNSDGIYAISTITNNMVDGGTGWAVHMAIINNKVVFVFDQKQKKWFTWKENEFKETETPILCKQFAGIGTREINEDGKQAIHNVYQNTVKNQ